MRAGAILETPLRILSMKRFFFISAFFHGALLVLLLSWEVPLAGRLSPMVKILEVSLVEMQENKPEEKKIEDRKPAAPKKLAKVRSVEKAEVKARPEMPPVAASPNPEEKKEIRGPDLTEPEKAEVKKQVTEPGDKGPAEERVLKASAEEPPSAVGEMTPRGAGGGAANESAPGSEAHRNRTEKGNSGATFLASVGPELRDRNQAGDGGGSGTAGGGATRLANIRTGGEGDSILSEIIRRIEKAKLYPRAARKMGIEGKAAVRFKLKPDGKVASAEVVESSGSDILDKASLETVQRAAPLPYKEGWLKVVIVFKIL
jgi:TonB family protein